MFLFCQARLLKVAGLADGLTWSGIAEVGILAGWDFTVALFIAGLSFGHANIVATAKVSILAAPLVSGTLGYFCLGFALKDDSLRF